MILNQVMGSLGLKLATPFYLVHNAKPYSNIWIELLYIEYFNHRIDNTESRSKLQAHTLDGISVGSYDKPNSVIFVTLSLPVTITRLLSA